MASYPSESGGQASEVGVCLRFVQVLTTQPIVIWQSVALRYSGLSSGFVVAEQGIVLVYVGCTSKGALKCSFFAVAALVGAGLLSCCLLRQPASFTAQPTNEQFQDPLQ